MAISGRLTSILAVLCATNVFADFNFPESEDADASKRNAENKTPLLAPQLCNENEFYYPGDQKDDWVCDCKPGYIYYPKTDHCHSAYRQGPCPTNEFLIIPTGQ